MKLFLDRNRTLLPRIDVIYLLSRIMTLSGILWISYDTQIIETNPAVFWTLFLTYIAHTGVFVAAMRDRFDMKLAYFSAILYDLILIPLVISASGGVESSMYLMYFLTISVAGYLLTFWCALSVVMVVTAVYSTLMIPELWAGNLFDFSMRVGFLWIYFLAISYVSEYMRKSERRLMKLFDTLNLRTAELERSQAQLEIIYENSRTLASLLDAEDVIHEVMRILSDTLRYQYCAIVQQDKWGNYFYRARFQDKQMLFTFKAIPGDDIELINRVVSVGEPIRIKDIASRGDYHPLCERAQSAMLVPMVTHGRTKGLLVAESMDNNAFTDRDIEQLNSVGRSTAMALENAELHQRTEDLTITDELTGAYNYRYFVLKLEEEKKRALRYSVPLSIIMVDIDWFKKINDSYGHEIGNVVLRELSRVIKRCIRDVDIFTRYGGEEFAIILPQTPQSEASHIGERIRSQVEDTIIETEHAGKLKITVSVGVSAYPENGKSHEELVTIADQALYRAKGSGKNLVCSI